MSNLQFVVIVSVSCLLLTASAAFMDKAYSQKRKECLESGYTWSKTKYVCIATLTKR